MKKALVVTDNRRIFECIKSESHQVAAVSVISYACSLNSPLLSLSASEEIHVIDLKRDWKAVDKQYDLVLSAHSKQIFPAGLVEANECINIHPGYNPETRGWYPQVFAILNGLRVGVTIHRMDEEIDHGPIIYREEVPTFFWDTSGSVYERIMQCEERILHTWLPRLLTGTYSCLAPEGEGHKFSKKDFAELCKIDLNEVGSFEHFYNRLRAVSFAGQRNAYVLDPRTGDKIYVEVKLTRAGD